VQVLRSEADVRTDFARSIRPKLAGCIAYQLKQSGAIAHVRVERIPFPRVGTVSAAYRATLTVRNGARTIKLYGDYVFVGVGRYEYALRVLAPAAAGAQLVNFESAMARILVKRVGKPCC
jgi:hypothetical protein